MKTFADLGGNREQGTGMVAAARSAPKISTEKAAAVFPVPSCTPFGKEIR